MLERIPSQVSVEALVEGVGVAGGGLPKGHLSAGFPGAELQGLELLAGYGVFGQREGLLLEVKGAQSLQLALDRDPVVGGLAREVVDQDQPPRLPRTAYSSVHTIPARAPTGTIR
jgi:hypothetical protein